jgi:hypothetical protein
MGFNKSTWIGRYALKRLQRNLIDLELDSDIIESIDGYLSINNRGNYLINIFSDEQIYRLQQLEKDWNLF